MESEFDIIEQTAQYIYIIDLDNGRSVTNDAKNVVKLLYENYDLGSRRLIYRDSMGQIDEILHENGMFIDFKAGHEGIELPDLESGFMNEFDGI